MAAKTPRKTTAKTTTPKPPSESAELAPDGYGRVRVRNSKGSVLNVDAGRAERMVASGSWTYAVALETP